MEPAPEKLWHLPNLLTVARIVAVPVVMILLCFKGPVASFLCAMFFMAAGATDFFDGFLARRHMLMSSFGKFMDPLADKLLVSAALIMLIPLGRVPAWIAFIIIGRELAVTGLRALAAAEGIILAPDRWGKAKTFFQMAALTALILHYTYHAVDFQRLGMGLLWLAMVVTITSGVSYFLTFFRQYPESQQS